MSKFKISTFVFLIITILTVSCGKKEEVPVAEPEMKFDFKVQFVLGDVKISSSSGEKAANPGDGLATGDAIVTGKKSVADLLYGKSGVIRINENSRLLISAIADKTNSDSVMDMDNGKVFCTLTKLKGTGFKVKTPTAVASVRGTSFTVLSDKKGSKLAVVKGTVAVNPVKEGKIIEEKSIDVVAGKKTDYIDKKAVEQIIMGKMEIPVMEMTPAEKIEIRSEVNEIKIEQIPEISIELKEEITKETEIESVPKDDSAKQAELAETAKKIADEKKRKENELKKQQDELKKQDEERIKKEEELKRLAEEKKKKEEQVKKDRASNIPTM